MRVCSQQRTGKVLEHVTKETIVLELIPWKLNYLTHAAYAEGCFSASCLEFGLVPG